jgi:hypothetical protein
MRAKGAAAESNKEEDDYVVVKRVVKLDWLATYISREDGEGYCDGDQHAREDAFQRNIARG